MVEPTLHAPSPLVKIPNGDPGVTYREIVGHPGYAVGDDGSAWSARKLRGLGYGKGTVAYVSETWRKLSPSLHHGYPYIDLCCDGKSKLARLSVLVLTAFVGPRPAGMQARHFPDRDTTNNRLSNLLWGTHVENAADRIIQETRCIGEKNGLHKITAEAVRSIRARHSLGETQPALAEEFGIDQATVSKIVLRKTWRHVA